MGPTDWQLWVIWFVGSMGIFTWLEIRGLRKYGVKGTLSFLFWYVLFSDWDRISLGLYPRKPRIVIYFIVLAPFVWLILHFALGGRV